jgi:hypothetical protein
MQHCILGLVGIDLGPRGVLPHSGSMGGACVDGDRRLLDHWITLGLDITSDRLAIERSTHGRS